MKKDWMTMFIAFDRENPHVYELFKQYAFEAINAGKTQYGAKAVWNRIRWHSDVEFANDNSWGGDDIRLNDSHVGFYARMFMWEFPKHKEFFNRRVSFIYAERFDQWLKEEFEDEEAA